jgi:hypothetical protein
MKYGGAALKKKLGLKLGSLRPGKFFWGKIYEIPPMAGRGRS